MVTLFQIITLLQLHILKNGAFGRFSAQDTILPDNEQCHMSVEACPAAAQDTILPDNGQCHVFVEAGTAAANATLPGVEIRHAFVKAGTVADWSHGTTGTPCYVDAGRDPTDTRTRVR